MILCQLRANNNDCYVGNDTDSCSIYFIVMCVYLVFPAGVLGGKMSNVFKTMNNLMMVNLIQQTQMAAAPLESTL